MSDNSSGPARPDRRPLSRRVAWAMAAAIPTVVLIGVAVEPAANGPEPTAPLWADLLAGTTALVALWAVVALTAVHRSGVLLAAVTGAGLLTLAVTCPMSGHHVIGTYTYVQSALFGGLLAGSLLVLATRGSATRNRLVELRNRLAGLP
jgi:peptidoglycan/LPS O-acetylase OafA/YrhL